jgi:RNA polymerase sigma-70 factor (ECF subfamily)
LKDPDRLETLEGNTMSLPKSDVQVPVHGAAAALDLDAIYRAHASTVARWANRLAGPGADVEDLVHEIFLVAGQRLSEFRGEAKVTTWLYRITERLALERRRRDRFRRCFSRVRSFDIENAFSPSQPTPVDVLERRQSIETVYRMLDRLPDKYRTVLILFEIEEMSGEEIATFTGQKESTVWVRLHRARRQFLSEIKRDLGREP